MSQLRALVVPHPRSMVRHALPNLVEGKLVPLVLFLGFLRLIGTTGAVLAALTWTASSIAWRLGTGRKVPGLVVLSAVGLTAKTVVTLATGSLLIYFLQPTIGTALVGLAFAVSVPLGRPLAERLAHDVLPFEPATAAHPHVRRFFVRLSLFWAVTSALNTAITLWLLLTQSVTTFVLVKAGLGPASTALAVGASLVWLRVTSRRQGLSLVLAPARAV